MKEQEQDEPELEITDDMGGAEPETAEPARDPEVVAEPETVAPVAVAGTSSQAEVKASKASETHKLRDFLATKRGKVITIVTAAVVILVVLFAIPLTRYTIAGVVVKKDVALTIVDKDSKKPVSGAIISMGTFAAVTDAKGVAHVGGVPVGEYQVRINKKYYFTSTISYTVPLLASPADVRPELQATGRNVEISVTNKITAAPIKGASITISGSSVTTDEKGIANIILPVKSEAQKGEVRTGDYNDASFDVKVTNSDDQKLSVQQVPNGEIYFLSKRTGKINIMKTSLDGSAQSVVVEGTGREDDNNTVLLSTTDWKYGALLAERDSDKPKIYLLNNGTLSVIDEGDADFQLIGWSGHQFVFLVTRNTKNFWDDKRQALKSYNADTGKLTTLDETQGAGSGYYDYAAESIANVYAAGGTLVYTKSWDLGSYTMRANYKSSITSVDVSGTGKKSLQDFPLSQFAYFDAKLYAPGEIYFRVASSTGGDASYYEYDDGKITATTGTNDQKFYNTFYATYLLSPSGNKTLWYEPRDGKNAVFVGDKDGKNAREIGTSDDTPYGWYSDDYVLLAKNSSELYVYGASLKLSDTSQPLKITDYHKPALTFPGYGGGYGGQ